MTSELARWAGWPDPDFTLREREFISDPCHPCVLPVQVRGSVVESGGRSLAKALLPLAGRAKGGSSFPPRATTLRGGARAPLSASTSCAG